MHTFSSPRPSTASPPILRGGFGRILNSLKASSQKQEAYIGLTFHETPPYIPCGDAGQGKWICAGQFATHNQRIYFGETPWQNPEIEQQSFWKNYAHSFSWLDDLRCLGGNSSRLTARNHVKSWIDMQSNQEKSWDGLLSFSKPKYQTPLLPHRITALSISNLLYHFDFYGRTATDEFIEQLLAQIVQKANYLRALPEKNILPDDIFETAKALIYSGLALKFDERHLVRGTELLTKAINDQILPDGGHISRSPNCLLANTQICLDIYLFMKKCHAAIPPILLQTLDRMAQAIRFFTNNGSAQSLPLFQGCAYYDASQAKKILQHLNARSGKILQQLPNSGYYRVKKGRMTLICDTGSAPNQPYCARAHSAPASFEMTLGNEKVISNCGSHPILNEWASAFRATAAHTALTIADRNAFEIHPDGHLNSGNSTVNYTENKLADGILLEIEHDAYDTNFNITHKRRLFCDNKGLNIAGEDILLSEIRRSAPIEYSIRFHLSPMIQAAIVNNGEEVLLRLPSGRGISFKKSDAKLSIEPSIMICKDNVLRKTTQIVLEGRFGGGIHKTCWSFSVH